MQAKGFSLLEFGRATTAAQVERLLLPSCRKYLNSDLDNTDRHDRYNKPSDKLDTLEIHLNFYFSTFNRLISLFLAISIGMHSVFSVSTATLDFYTLTFSTLHDAGWPSEQLGYL